MTDKGTQGLALIRALQEAEKAIEKTSDPARRAWPARWERWCRAVDALLAFDASEPEPEEDAATQRKTLLCRLDELCDEQEAEAEYAEPLARRKNAAFVAKLLRDAMNYVAATRAEGKA